MSEDIYGTHRFTVELQGITEGFFTSCSGLESEVEVEEWKEGGWNSTVRRFVGRAKLGPNLVLKRGLASPALWQWYHDVTQGKVKRQNLSIILTGYDSMPVIRWDFTGALPVKWSGPSFTSDAREVAVESIELIHQGFERKK